MEHKVNEHVLTEVQSKSVLKKEEIGIFATTNEDGTPYAIPMHYIFFNDRVYMWTRPHGQKVTNIVRDPRCSFAVLNLASYDSVNKVEFESVVVKGKARMISDDNDKVRIISDIYEKYGKNKDITLEKVKMTGVIEVIPDTITGKYRSGL